MAIVLPVSMAQMKDKNEVFFIEIYDIKLRTGDIHLCACDTDITFDGVKYLALPIQRESITRSMDNITDSCQLTIGDVSYELLSYVMNGYDPRMSEVLVRRIQYPDSLTNPKIFQWLYYGYLDEMGFSNGTFSCKIMTRFPEIDVPNRSYRLACNSEFGDSECQASLRTTATTITAANGNNIYFRDSFSDDFWRNGVATVDGESRIIVTSSGNNAKLNVNFIQENIVGKMCELRRGCNKSKEDCKRFDNLRNYSGFPAIPFESVYR